MNKKYWFDILVSAQDNAHLTGESTSLVCVQLKKWDFEKIFNKSDGDFQQLLCKKTVQVCTVQKKILMTFQYFKFSFVSTKTNIRYILWQFFLHYFVLYNAKTNNKGLKIICIRFPVLRDTILSLASTAV